jgi:hypothetical protein
MCRSYIIKKYSNILINILLFIYFVFRFLIHVVLCYIKRHDFYLIKKKNFNGNVVGILCEAVVYAL